MTLCEMALRTGLPQRVLERRFTVAEMDELLAYKAIEFRAVSKEDVRAQLLAYHIVTSNLAAMGGSKAVRNIKPKAFAIEWGKEAKPGKTKKELSEMFIALAEMYSRKNRTKGKAK